MKYVALLLMALFCIGCGKRENPAPAETGSGQQAGNKMFTIDGLGEDWSGVEPVWAEAGAVGRGKFGDGIDIKNVMMQNDENYLYIFLQCSPSIDKRFEVTKTSGHLCDIYFNTDNDKSTGCSKVEAFEYGKIDGYEFKLWVPVGIAAGVGGQTCFVSYDLITPDEKGKFGFDSVASQSSEASGFIQHGADGVEICLPLDKLKLKSKTFGLLFQETADPFSAESFSEGSYTVK